MYNGIGLKTARGSGTNGYVTRNLSFVKPKNYSNKPFNYNEAAAPPKTRKPNDDILLHKSKRQIEVECLQLREKLEFEKVAEEEIDRKVKRLRDELTNKLEDRLANMKEEVLMEKKDREMKRLKKAFGITDDFKEGRGFNFETEKQREERLARIADEEKAARLRRRN